MELILIIQMKRINKNRIISIYHYINHIDIDRIQDWINQ